jgi:quercetin dioxygenase-like cupin family protein
MKHSFKACLLMCGLTCVLAGCSAIPRATAGDTSKQTLVSTLLTQPLAEKAGSEVRMLTVEYPPAVASAPHHHPGAVFVYVLEGAVDCALDNGPVVRYEKGQTWYEHPNQLHRVAKNASRTQPAKLLVFFLTDPGKPVLEREK